MRTPFSKWGYNEALAALQARQKEGDAESLAYIVEKDNWQNGRGCTLPMEGGDSATNKVLSEGTNRVFTAKGSLPGIVRRHRRGVVGRESIWTIYLRRALQKIKDENGKDTVEKPNDKEQEKIDLAYSLILEFWNRNKGLTVFRQMVTHYCATGRGPLRLFWRPDKLQNGQMPRVSFQEAVTLIHLLAPKPDEAAIVTDKWTLEQAAIYTFEDEDGKTAIGFCYVENGKTIIKTLREGGSSLTQQAPGLIERAREFFAGDNEPVKPLDLNGHLPLFEMDGEALITEPLKRQQKLLDKAWTMLSYLLDEAGFREITYLNALPPGKTLKIDDPDNPGQKVEVFLPGSLSNFPRGPRAINFVRGLTYTEKDAVGATKTHLAAPQREVTDPVAVTTQTEAIKVTHESILQDADQGHLSISSDGNASGESQKQQRDDYIKSLEETKSEVDYVGSQALDAFLALVAVLAGKPGYFSELRVSFDARIDPGPLSSEDRKQIIEEVKTGMRSLESGMQLLGISDPDAMKRKLVEEEEEAASRDPEKIAKHLDNALKLGTLVESGQLWVNTMWGMMQAWRLLSEDFNAKKERAGILADARDESQPEEEEDEFPEEVLT